MLLPVASRGKQQVCENSIGLAVNLASFGALEGSPRLWSSIKLIIETLLVVVLPERPPPPPPPNPPGGLPSGGLNFPPSKWIQADS